MKAHVCTKTDWEYNVIDVFLILEHNQKIIERDIKGFDDDEWENANDFAKKLAETLHIEFVGDRTDT